MPQPRARATSNVRRGREGSRWINHRPEPEEFAEWFATVPLHTGLEHQKYVGGVVLIQQTMKEKVVGGFREDGSPVIGERQDLVYTPHPNVSTRVRYWQDFLELDVNEQAVGVVEVNPPGGLSVAGLPDGFFKYVAQDAAGKAATFIGCSMRVRLLRRGTVRYVDARQGPLDGLVLRRRVEGDVLAEFAPGTKVVPVSNRWGADENAVMKAETGALGRALGVAGMLVIPGAGVATAEDMHEALSGENRAEAGATLPEPTGPAAPNGFAPEPDRRAQLSRLVKSMGDEAREQFQAWARDRKITLADANDAELHAALKRAEQLIG